MKLTTAFVTLLALAPFTATPAFADSDTENGSLTTPFDKDAGTVDTDAREADATGDIRDDDDTSDLEATFDDGAVDAVTSGADDGK